MQACMLRAEVCSPALWAHIMEVRPSQPTLVPNGPTLQSHPTPPHTTSTNGWHTAARPCPAHQQCWVVGSVHGLAHALDVRRHPRGGLIVHRAHLHQQGGVGGGGVSVSAMVGWATHAHTRIMPGVTATETSMCHAHTPHMLLAHGQTTHAHSALTTSVSAQQATHAGMRC